MIISIRAIKEMKLLSLQESDFVVVTKLMISFMINVKNTEREKRLRTVRILLAASIRAPNSSVFPNALY